MTLFHSPYENRTSSCSRTSAVVNVWSTLFRKSEQRHSMRPPFRKYDSSCDVRTGPTLPQTTTSVELSEKCGSPPIGSS